jgi:hypothetical protein
MDGTLACQSTGDRKRFDNHVKRYIRYEGSSACAEVEHINRPYRAIHSSIVHLCGMIAIRRALKLDG